MRWTQDGEDFEATVSGPLGIGTVRLEGDGRRVQAQTLDPLRPRRVALGLEYNRLAMMLAVLHRHGGIALAEHDVFINVVGGIRVSETSADLPMLLALVSSLQDRPFPDGLVCFGEVGLSGEIRPVHDGEQRLRRARVAFADRIEFIVETVIIALGEHDEVQQGIGHAAHGRHHDPEGPGQVAAARGIPL